MFFKPLAFPFGESGEHPRADRGLLKFPLLPSTKPNPRPTIHNLLQAFPLGGFSCRTAAYGSFGSLLLAKQGGEGRRSLLIFPNIFNKRFLKIKGVTCFLIQIISTQHLLDFPFWEDFLAAPPLYAVSLTPRSKPNLAPTIRAACFPLRGKWRASASR